MGKRVRRYLWAWSTPHDCADNNALARAEHLQNNLKERPWERDANHQHETPGPRQAGSESWIMVGADNVMTPPNYVVSTVCLCPTQPTFIIMLGVQFFPECPPQSTPTYFGSL